MALHWIEPVPSPEPAGTLSGLTEIAREAIGQGDVRIDHLPFRVGLERRRTSALWRGLERRLSKAQRTNDLYLIDAAWENSQVAPEHFMITEHEGRLVVVDRGSRHGTGVGAQRLGGHGQREVADLHHGDLITVGSPASPFIYRFRLKSGLPGH